MPVMNSQECDPLYPFTNLNNINSLFNDVIPFTQLDSMIYDPYGMSDEDDPNDPDYFNLNSIEYRVPLSSYIFDTNSIPSSNDFLKLRSFNIRSTTKHLDQWLDNLNSSFDILCLCETFLTEELQNEVYIEPFQGFHQCRNRDGGGVSVYVRDDLSPVHLPHLSFTCDSMEAVTAQFSVRKGKRDVVVSVYRPPSANVHDFITKMEELMKDIRRQNFHDVYIAGDFNIDLLKEDNDKIELTNFMHAYNHYCAINKPTRVTDTSATLIDHVWVSNADRIHSSYIVVDDETDHYPVECLIRLTNATRSPINVVNKRLFKDEAKQAFKLELSRVNWDDVYSIEEPNAAYECFVRKFLTLYDKHFPKRQFNVRYNSRDTSYLTAAIRESLREKRRLHRLAKKYPITYHEQYIQYRNTCNETVRAARNKHFQDKLQASSGNSRSLWKEINHVMGRTKKGSDPLITLPEGSTLSHANYVNNYFSDSIQALKQQQITPDIDGFRRYLNPPTDFSLRLSKVTAEEIFKYINENKSNASGFDDIDPRIVKLTADILKNPLAYIVNASIKSGIFPDELKIAKIIPLHKKGDKTNVENKRPISILNVFAKVFEKALHVRLSEYLEKFNLLTMNQHGFRRNHSTESALLNFIKEFHDAINNKKKAIAVFIDFSKAFDCLDHRTLLCKMENLGIRGLALNLMESYLTSRKQYVYYNNEYSAPLTPKFGTPQGSLLGPLIFLIYVNDIVNASESLSFAMYADDVNTLKSDESIRNLVNELNSQLVFINDWIVLNGLSLNIVKICHMLINGDAMDDEYEIKIGETVIPRVQTTKLLGLYVDEGLKWNTHTNYVADKIAKVCGIIYNIRNKLTPIAMRTIYMSLIYSHITYCIPIWGNTWAVHLRPVKLAQKRAVRTISNVARFDHTHELFVSLKILKLRYVYQYFSLVLTHKYMYGNYVPLVFTRANNPYNIRNVNNIHVPRCRTTLFQKSVYYAAPSMWYNLDNVLKTLVNVHTFKSRLKEHLLSMQIQDS